MQKKSKRNSGFTLVELSVALGVGAIVLAVLSLSIYYLQSAFKTSEFVSNSTSEYDSVKAKIIEVSNSWVDDGYSLKTIDGKLCCVNAGEEVVGRVFYKDNVLYQNDEKLIDSQSITSINFNLKNETIIAVVLFTNNQQMRFII